MADNSGRANSITSPSSDPGFVLPLSSQRLNVLQRFLSSVSSPFLSSAGADASIRDGVRRFTGTSQTSEERDPLPSAVVFGPPLYGERRRAPALLGHWSSEDIYTQRDPSVTINPVRRTSLGNLTANSLPISRDNVVINMEGGGTGELINRPINSSNDEDNGDDSSNDSDSGNLTGENAQQGEEGRNSVRINGESISEMLERHPEIRQLLKALWQYFVFVLIILIKMVFDRFTSLLILLAFWFSFFLGNKVVKTVLSQPTSGVTPKHALGLALMFIMIPLGIFLFYYTAPTNMYYSAILLPSDYQYLTLGDLLWMVIVTDYILKLVTVVFKGFYATIPCVFIHHKQRGKHLALVEITSQLYRSFAPVQPWLAYLLDNYTGIQKVFGVFLSAAYMLCKGPDIIFRVKNFHFVFKKFMEKANYGSTPTEAQLKDTGSVCPICQDDFVVPTMLPCKHIFCEQCVARWFDRERTCPMCRTKVADDPKFRDGSTSHAVQLY